MTILAQIRFRAIIRLMRLAFLGLLFLSSVAGVGLAQRSVDEVGKEGCAALVNALGMPAMRGSITKDPRGGLTYLRWGRQWCAYDTTGKAVGAADLAQLEASGGSPRLRASAEVVTHAKRYAKAAGLPLLDDVTLNPPAPWKDDVGPVMATSRGIAFGRPTNGYAGGTRIQVNRLTGKVASLVWTPEFKIAKPAVKIQKAKAFEIAETAFGKIRQSGRAFSVSGVLQYFRPYPARATTEGARLNAKRELRLCWVVTLSSGGGVSEMSAPVASAAIDAETGKLISRP